MKRVPKKIEELIEIVSGIPSDQYIDWSAGAGRMYDRSQIIATALAGALIAISKGTQYDDLCKDIINKCVEIDPHEIIDRGMLDIEGSKD